MAQNLQMKKLLEFSCYIKLEKNNMEIKTKNHSSNNLSKVFLYEISSKNDSNKILNVNLKNSINESFYSFNINEIERTIDRLITEGKLTFIVNKNNERFVVFLSKTTKDILENFLKQLFILGRKEKEIGIIKEEIKIIEKKNEVVNFKLNKKRKFQELYNNPNFKNELLEKKARKNLDLVVDYLPKIKNMKIIFLDLPYDVKISIFEFVDRPSLTKISLLNKESKSLFDNYIEKLELRPDTPTLMFNILLKRFSNLSNLSLGKAKFLKNENLKYFDVSLKNIKWFDISHIINLNDHSITKLFSKTKANKIKHLKLNFFLMSLYSALIYLNEFCHSLESLDIFSHYQLTKAEGIIKDLEQNNFLYHINEHKTLFDLLISKKSLKSLNIFCLNFKIIDSKNTFSNLRNLQINIIVIEKVKNLKILSNAINLENLKIKEICILDNRVLNRVDFDNGNYLNLQEAEIMMNNLSLDFDNDYLETFIQIFIKLRKLQVLELGHFVNGDIAKIISLHCKNLFELSLNSPYINDDHLKPILQNLTNLTYLDLKGCFSLQGSCFIDYDPLPEKLKKIKTSITNFNAYNLMEFLKGKGITAENYSY